MDAWKDVQMPKFRFVYALMHGCVEACLDLRVHSHNDGDRLICSTFYDKFRLSGA